MGAYVISNAKRSKLKSYIIMLKGKWELANDKKKVSFISLETVKGGLLAIAGGLIGGLLGGPPGVVIGAAVFGTGSAATSVVISQGHDETVSCVYQPL